MTWHNIGWQRFVVLSVIAVAIATFLGWQSGYTIAETGAPLAPTRWSLPTPISEEPDKDLATLTGRRPWSGALPGTTQGETGANRPATGSAGSAAALTWRLAGLVERADGNFVLIATGPANAAKFEYRGLGDKLPDGSTLVEITVDHATVETGGTNRDRRVLRLFRGAAAAAAGPPAVQPQPTAAEPADVVPAAERRSATGQPSVRP
jgi:hypothetical protein